MRKVISMLMCLLLCFSFPMTANAKMVPTNAAQPYYEMASKAESKLSINGTTATCESILRGDTDVVKIVAEQYLQRQGFLWIWSTYDDAEWTKTVYSNALTMSNTKTGMSSGKYRLKTVFTLTDKQGKTETITVYSYEKTVG